MKQKDNREIKFRVWDKNRSGYYKKCEVFDGNDMVDLALWILELEKIKEANWIYMQYTGLKDKQGKEIFEGDILKSVSKLNSDYRFEVEWQVPNSCPCCDQCSGWNVDIHTEYEVVGNIFENKEV